MENTFTVGEIVKIKRTSGVWEFGEIADVFPHGVAAKIKITDSFRGKPYNGPWRNGYKFIRNEDFGTYLKKYRGGSK